MEGFFFWVVASHFGVVSLFLYVLSQFVMAPCGWCLRFSLACHCPSQYAHTYSWAGIFFCFLTALRPTLGSWYTGSCGFSSPLGLPTFAMGSPLRGRGQIVLDRNEGLVSPFGSGTLVSSWLDIPPLSAGIGAPCHSEYVAWWSSLCPYH